MIARRVDQQFERGVVDEVRTLVAARRAGVGARVQRPGLPAGASRCCNGVRDERRHARAHRAREHALREAPGDLVPEGAGRDRGSRRPGSRPSAQHAGADTSVARVLGRPEPELHSPEPQALSRLRIRFLSMSTIREDLEAREREFLAPQAAKSADEQGRRRPEPEDPIRPAFQRDRDRVIHSKAFRRLKHKTQVFFSPTGDHYRTRLTHTLEVSQIARSIAKVLRLHEELTEAIALGHDLGHPPFGHAGERVIDRLVPGGFSHYAQSLRIVDVLENGRQGLNLTWEVRDGIARHSKGKHGLPVGAPKRGPGEHDRRANRAGRRHHRVRQPRHRRCGASGRAGRRTRCRRRRRPCSVAPPRSGSTRWSPTSSTATLDGALVEVRMSDEILGATLELREFLFEAVYENPVATAEFVFMSLLARLRIARVRSRQTS